LLLLAAKFPDLLGGAAFFWSNYFKFSGIINQPGKNYVSGEVMPAPYGHRRQDR
jgi:hypothetical protein